jgi:hypothetical protein
MEIVLIYILVCISLGTLVQIKKNIMGALVQIKKNMGSLVQIKKIMGSLVQMKSRRIWVHLS